MGMLHPAYKTASSSFSYDKGGHCRLAASLLAVKEINADTTILPNTNIIVEWIDSKRDSATALMGAITHSQGGFGGDGADVVVGPASSGPSKASNLVLGAIPIPVPQMSYSATSPSLSEKEQFQTFFRTPPSDAFQGTTLAEVLYDELDYTEFCMIIASDDYSSAGAKAFEDAAVAKGMNLVNKQIVSENPEPNEVYEAVSKTRDSLCRVVFVMSQACAGGKITAQAKNEGIMGADSGYLWVLTDAWSTNRDGALTCADVTEGFEVTEAADKATPFTVPGLDAAAFNEAWTGALGASPLFPSAGMAKFDAFLTSWGAQTDTNGVCAGDGGTSPLEGTARVADGSTCTCSSEVDNAGNKLWELDHDEDPATPSICTGFEYSGADNAKPASGYAYFAYDAVLAYATAAHHALYDSSSPFTGSDFKTLEGKQAIMQALYEISFEGVSGPISFNDASAWNTGDRADGNGNTVSNFNSATGDFDVIGEWRAGDAAGAGWKVVGDFTWDAYTWATSDNSKPKNIVLPKCEVAHIDSAVADCGSDGKRKATFSYVKAGDGVSPTCDPDLPGSLPLPPSKDVNCSYSPADSLGGSLAIILGAGGAVVCILWAVYVFININTKVMRVAQPSFCIVFTLSAALLSISNVLFVGENTDSNCLLRPFVFNIAFDLMFGSLFMKTLRVYKIFGNRKLSKVKISSFDIIKNYGSIIMVDIVILIVWNQGPGMTAETITMLDLDPYPSYTSVICKDAETYSTLTTFFKILMVIGGVYLSYLTRNVPDKFAESKWIAIEGGR
ncbi:hypothetical protein TrRE_jg4582 [Triparma retinervis]|uniref:G-protein coupled receptors family 3 profile domain-containing protein n=1 Tax=Triparma retinervis TaxID=2557542 RepID=A0A9W7A167_9STRA|nr:hypothetical protein TrRE_jg4582 [Triparma retinervis]